MKLKQKIALLASGLIFSSTVQAQQNFTYNNYMDNMGPINPTWYLSDTSASIHSVVRKQWVGIDGAPTIYVLNGHIPFISLQAATGLNLSYDTFGPEKLLNMSAFFAKSVRLSERGDYLSASLSLGVSRYDALYSSLDAQDPSFRQDVSGTTGTIGLGIMFYKPEQYFVGVSMPHLSMQELGKASTPQDYQFSTPYYAMMGYLARIDEVFKVKPVVMGTLVKGLPTNYDFSATLYIQDALGLGLSYGTNRELGTRVSFYPSEHFRFGYSYQFGTESYGMSNKGNNTHEIGLGYRFGNGVKRKLL